MKRNYVPTEADRATGENVRNLRRLHSETLIETIERAGLSIGQSSLSRIELGQRPLNLREATKLAAHWDTIPEKIFVRRDPIAGTIQTPEDPKPALFAVPEIQTELERRAAAPARHRLIDLEDPMTPEQYRLEVWLPYLEARYATEQRAS